MRLGSDDVPIEIWREGAFNMPYKITRDDSHKVNSNSEVRINNHRLWANNAARYEPDDPLPYIFSP